MTLSNDCENREHLRNTRILSKDAMSLLHNLMSVHQFQAGSFLYSEGDQADKLFFLIKGSVKLIKSSDDGRDLSFAYFGPEDLFGEFNFYEFQQTCSFTAEALTECEIGIIVLQELEGYLVQDGAMAMEFMKWNGYMQRFTQIKLRDLMFYGKTGSIASTLIRIANTYGLSENGRIFIQKRFTNTDIANLIGATRETVNRVFSSLKKDEVIEQEHGHLIIKDLQALKLMCHCEGCPAEICRI